MTMDDRRSVPLTTADYLEFHALERPNAVAILDRARRITFGEFQRDLMKLTRALRDFGLAPGSTIAVSGADLYASWLLLLAAENLGLVSANYLPNEGAEAARLVSYVDFVIAPEPLPNVPIKRFHKLTAEWLAGVLARDAPDDYHALRVRPGGPDEIIRITRSSGTTGGQKMMLLSRRYWETGLQNFLHLTGATQSSVCLIAFPFTVGASYMRATLYLRLGAICLMNVPIDRLAALGCTHAWMQPQLLASILDRMPANFVKPSNLKIQTGAAPLSASLRQRALQQFASEITHSYAANEVCWIGVVGHDGVATALPGVEIDVVDEGGAPVPTGEVGTLRVRTQTMVAGYVNMPERTTQMFRDGWFHTGDAGVKVGRRGVRILGRRDELLNVGGIKLAPEALEDHMKRASGVTDIGVVPIAGPEGLSEIGIAFVVPPGANQDVLVDAMRKSVADLNLKVMFRAVERLPRTENGKLRRHVLMDLLGGSGFAPASAIHLGAKNP